MKFFSGKYQVRKKMIFAGTTETVNSTMLCENIEINYLPRFSLKVQLWSGQCINKCLAYEISYFYEVLGSSSSILWNWGQITEHLHCIHNTE